MRNKGIGASKIYESILTVLLDCKQAFEANCANLRKQSEESPGSGGKNSDDDRNMAAWSQLHGLTCTTPEKTARCANLDDVVFSKHKTGGSKPKEVENVLPGKSTDENLTPTEFFGLSEIFDARLKNCLKEQMKFCGGAVRTLASSTQQNETVLKQMFELVLRASLLRKSEKRNELEHCEQLVETVIALEKLRSKEV